MIMQSTMKIYPMNSLLGETNTLYFYVAANVFPWILLFLCTHKNFSLEKFCLVRYSCWSEHNLYGDMYTPCMCADQWSWDGVSLSTESCSPMSSKTKSYNNCGFFHFQTTSTNHDIQVKHVCIGEWITFEHKLQNFLTIHEQMIWLYTKASKTCKTTKRYISSIF